MEYSDAIIYAISNLPYIIGGMTVMIIYSAIFGISEYHYIGPWQKWLCNLVYLPISAILFAIALLSFIKLFHIFGLWTILLLALPLRKIIFVYISGVLSGLVIGIFDSFIANEFVKELENSYLVGRTIRWDVRKGMALAFITIMIARCFWGC